MKEEIWKDIEGYEGLYQVSNLGRVRSLERYENNGRGYVRFRKSKILKMSKTTWGYLYVNLCKNGKAKLGKIHRLVAETFISNPEAKPKVNHIDGNKENNHVENLEWCTQKENIAHAIEKGLTKTGADNKSAKLSLEQVEEIRRLYKPYDKKHSTYALAKKYGVHRGTIQCIIDNKTYKN